MYISKDNFESGTWAKTLVHEYTHYAEGTREYDRLEKLLRSNRAFAKAVDTKMMSMGYGFDIAKLEAIEKKALSNEELTADEKSYYDTIRLKTRKVYASLLLFVVLFIFANKWDFTLL